MHRGNLLAVVLFAGVSMPVFNLVCKLCGPILDAAGSSHGGPRGSVGNFQYGMAFEILAER
jgi:hypothetical protein